ncbi:MAG TPA: hypothetical protein VHU62_07700 [Mycobacterium sp.]|nr:hypothetical protein [Mycobacterium sp.]
MTGLAQSTSATEPRQPGEAAESAKPTEQTEPARRAPRRFSAVGGWGGIGWLVCGVVGGVAIAWFIFLSPGELGSRAEWFFGAVVFGAVVVGMWQTTIIQRQAKRDAAEAAERLRSELAAAQERSERELALTQTFYRAEMEAQRESHRAEMEAQRELARVERIHLHGQLQKQAMIDVSRAVNTHVQLLATVWSRGASILGIEDRDAREEAMSPIFEEIGRLVNDFSVELANANLLIEDDRVHQALNRVNAAVLMAIRVAEDVHVAVVEGHAPDPNSAQEVQRLMRKRAAEARHLAWDLLRAGLHDNAVADESQ